MIDPKDKLRLQSKDPKYLEAVRKKCGIEPPTEQVKTVDESTTPRITHFKKRQVFTRKKKAVVEESPPEPEPTEEERD